MTKVLAQAFDEASKLSEREQNAIGEWLLTEIRSERDWDRSFAESPGELSRLAKQALEEHRRGETDELDPDRL
jgi:hypothetical protein